MCSCSGITEVSMFFGHNFECQTASDLPISCFSFKHALMSPSLQSLNSQVLVLTYLYFLGGDHLIQVMEKNLLLAFTLLLLKSSV